MPDLAVGSGAVQGTEAFAKFGSDLDKATLAQLTRGEHMVEVPKQKQYSPMDVVKQIAIIFAGTKGHLDDIPIENISEFETGFLIILMPIIQRI
ncbi:MAG: hypothetical protein Ct9H300mP29_8290 [Candidatus Neomarinimicrobiota bacterium]|nr:MAG: hypothetical protein Ct9H300mP29_8290 [Candidatus Neomarinimicrobiota bacterium]